MDAKQDIQLTVDPGFTAISSKTHLSEHCDGKTTERRRLCGRTAIILIAVGLFVLVASFTFGIVYTLTRECVGQSKTSDADTQDALRSSQKTPFSFEDIFNSSLMPRFFSADFVGEGSKMVYRDKDHGSLMEYDLATGRRSVIMDNSTFLTLNTGTYFVSWDLRYVLLAYEQKYIWRHSYNAKYKIYERYTGRLLPIPNHPQLENLTLQLCRFAARTNQLGFVYDNNLYYQMDPTAAPVQLTTDGDKYYIYNGIADYLYEEDVLGKTSTHYFSSDGRYLLYAKLNDTQVPLMSMVLYGDKSTMYPNVVLYPYPKPGDLRDNNLGPNTEVSLFVVKLTSLHLPHWQVTPPTELGPEVYYTRVVWGKGDEFVVFWTNRAINRSIAMFCSASDLTCVKNHDLEVAGGWVKAPQTCMFVDGYQSYVTILPENLGVDGTWLHLAQVTLNPQGEGNVSFLSTGTQEVRAVVGYDESISAVYYLDTNGDPTERHLFRYYLDTNGDPTERHLFRVGTKMAAPSAQNPTCLTCDLGPGCLYLSAEFSTDGKYYIRKCLGPDIPTYHLIGHETDIVLEDNEEVRDTLSEKLLPTREFLDIDLNNGYKANAEIIYPPGFTPDNNTYKYIQNVYAGPDSKDVTKAYQLTGGTNNWLTFLSSTHNVIVASVDGRGTSCRGEEYKFLLYKQLGRVEIEDQVAGAKFFKSQPYYDTSKGAAIFGWSYGGFAAAQSLAMDNDTFLCAIAVAPVTNFLYYDTAYTERFQGFANENPAGYENSDISNRAANFKNKLFMMNHGTADDNVQLQHFMQLSRALIENDVHFREQLYVDQNHGIGAYTRHLYEAFTDFVLRDCWNE